jgi:SAM-dependent methyltransferase
MSPLTRGHLEQLDRTGDALTVAGWVLNPLFDAHAIELLVDGSIVAESVPIERPDVKRACAWIPHAGRSGFHFDLQAVPQEGRLAIRGRRGNDIVSCLTVRVDVDSKTVLAAPRALIQRVAGHGSVTLFRAGALHAFTVFADAMARHMTTKPVRMLDWGCGCGRLTMPFLAVRMADEVHGCDVDPEAITWCQAMIPEGTFRRSDLFPPTSYPTAFFDLVVASSVFTHMSRTVQEAWLQELHRIVRPGGLLLASTHGQFAASFAFRARDHSLTQRLWHALRVAVATRRGFVDFPDAALDGIAEAGYYRAAFQTRAFTLSKWAQYFDIVEYSEAAFGFQDLVVMQRLVGNGAQR